MPDFGVSSLVGIIDGVKVLAFAVREGRVAVHCHAGLGRTGRNKYIVFIVHVHSLFQLVHIQWYHVCLVCLSVSLLNRCPDSLLPDLHPAHQRQ